MKLLLIEDDSNIVLSLYRALGSMYEMDSSLTGKSGLRKASTANYDVILLDLNLPDMSGLEICERLRADRVTTPILILSGAAETKKKVTLLDSGANDYLTKPFKREELEARLRVLTRHTKARLSAHNRLVVGDLTLDTSRHIATRRGKPIPLRRKEFTLLECLMQNAGTVVTKDLLIAHAWDDDQPALINTVHVHMNHLRKKIDQPFDIPLIRTVHGLGYKIDASKVANTTLRKGKT